MSAHTTLILRDERFSVVAVTGEARAIGDIGVWFDDLTIYMPRDRARKLAADLLTAADAAEAGQIDVTPAVTP